MLYQQLKKGNLHLLFSLSQIERVLPWLQTLAQNANQLFLHLALEDEAPEACLHLAQRLENTIKPLPIVQIASLSGASFLFHPPKAAPELQKAYDEIVFNQTQTSFSLQNYLLKYQEQEKPFSTLPPVSFVGAEPLESHDALIILEPDAEKITGIVESFEVSRNETKKSDFPSFDPVFITKRLPELLLITPKMPYPDYQGECLFRISLSPTLPEALAQQELRQLHLADERHFKLITKYLNNEAEIIYDGQKNQLCKPLITEEGLCVQTANESLLKAYEAGQGSFECFFMAGSFSLQEQGILEVLIRRSKEEEIRLLILDCPHACVWTDDTILSTKKEQSLTTLHQRLKGELS